MPGAAAACATWRLAPRARQTEGRGHDSISRGTPREERSAERGSFSRRAVFVGTGILAACKLSTLEGEAVFASEQGFGRYVKKRALEPLQEYVAPLLSAKSELQRAGRVADNDLDAARSLLREGTLGSLRINARAVGEYAERLETSTEAVALVNNINRSVEKFDAYLLRASRNQEEKRDPTELVTESLGAIDRLLETVPQDVMDDVEGNAPVKPEMAAP